VTVLAKKRPYSARNCTDGLHNQVNDFDSQCNRRMRNLMD